MSISILAIHAWKAFSTSITLNFYTYCFTVTLLDISKRVTFENNKISEKMTCLNFFLSHQITGVWKILTLIFRFLFYIWSAWNFRTFESFFKASAKHRSAFHRLQYLETSALNDAAEVSESYYFQIF